MSWAAMDKPAREWTVTPNLLDYDALCCYVSWDATRTPLERATGVSASERDYLTGQMAAART
jgi:hypothetical protein